VGRPSSVRKTGSPPRKRTQVWVNSVQADALGATALVLLVWRAMEDAASRILGGLTAFLIEYISRYLARKAGCRFAALLLWVGLLFLVLLTLLFMVLMHGQAGAR